METENHASWMSLSHLPMRRRVWARCKVLWEYWGQAALCRYSRLCFHAQSHQNGPVSPRSSETGFCRTVELKVFWNSFLDQCLLFSSVHKFTPQRKGGYECCSLSVMCVDCNCAFCRKEIIGVPFRDIMQFNAVLSICAIPLDKRVDKQIKCQMCWWKMTPPTSCHYQTVLSVMLDN